METNKEEMVKRVKRIVTGVVVGLIAIVLVFNSTYEVKEQEQAVLLTFGNATAVTDSGLHFKVPFIQRVVKVDTTIKGFSLGYNSETNESIEDESLMITSDYNFVNVHHRKLSL